MSEDTPEDAAVPGDLPEGASGSGNDPNDGKPHNTGQPERPFTPIERQALSLVGPVFGQVHRSVTKGLLPQFGVIRSQIRPNLFGTVFRNLGTSKLMKVDSQRLLAGSVMEDLARRIVAEQGRQWSAFADSVREQVFGSLDLPGMKNAFEQMRRLAESYLPENWRGWDIDFVQAWDVAREEGLALVWVPRGQLVTALLDAENAEARQRLLSNHLAEIVDDCAVVAATVSMSDLTVYRERIDQVVAAHRDGHTVAAQALAAVVVTSLLQKMYVQGKLRHIMKSPLRDQDPELASITRFKAALLIEASIPVVRSVGDFEPEEKWPTGFNRHLTLHQVSPRQYTDAHAVCALMLATALLAEAQALLTRGVLVAENFRSAS